MSPLKRGGKRRKARAETDEEETTLKCRKIRVKMVVLPEKEDQGIYLEQRIKELGDDVSKIVGV